MLRIHTIALSASVLVGFFASRADAEVVAVEITSREPVLDRDAFGGIAYEKLAGTIRFAFDLDADFNAPIVDLAKAPRAEDGELEGRVLAHADLMVLRPSDPDAVRGTAWVEVSNRGGKASLSYFNRAQSSANPTTPAHFGDGLLMRRGLTVIWVGWQFDVPREPGRLRLVAPTATLGGAAIEGLVRCDWTVDAPTPTLGLGHRNHVPYPVVDPTSDEHRLTSRSGRLAEREELERSAWRFSADGQRIERTDGAPFDGGRIWELVYVARDPVVVGLGLAAIRDVASYAKYDDDCPFGVDRAIAFGVSQTGRFLRHFLYQGFNTDEAGRAVYDGLLIHTAGAGRGSFNHRFGQPSRDAHRYSAFFYPTDLFPFASRTLKDPVAGVEDGLCRVLDERGQLPKVVTTNTGYEYWGRAAALLHVTPDGKQDVELLPSERLYHLASAQHFGGPWPPRDALRHDGAEVWRGDPLDFLLTLRALAMALVDWVEFDEYPPPSAYPRLADDSLVPLADLAWPKIPGLAAPTVAHEAYRVDYGSRWSSGIVSIEPPKLGPAFPVLVPQVDELGNERAGVPSVETLVPLATYAPWHVRPDGELTDFWGSYAPLPLEPSADDARPAVAALYPDRAAYDARVRAAAEALVEARTLLAEDVERVVARAQSQWEHAHRDR